MPGLDHLVYAVPDLTAGVEIIARATGVEAVAGGSHPGAGTRNALTSFDDHTYFEIISVDPEQPPPEQPRPFGVDPTRPPRLAGFAVHPTGGETIDAVADRMRSSGLPVGPITAMSRQRPDGVELRWRLTLKRSPEVESATGGAVPFVIDWGATETPALSAPRMGTLTELRIRHHDQRLLDAIGGLGIELTGGDVVLEAGDPGLVAVVRTTGGERIELR
jgi:hypothetical protein